MWFRRIFNANQQSRGDQNGSARGSSLLSPQAVRQLNRLQLNASRSLRGYSVGLRSSIRRKPSIEFREHRMYAPGDDVRFVDWKASARQDHVFIRQGEYNKEATVFLLLDCSASMTWGDPPKSQLLLSLAATLGYLALAHSDRLFVVPLLGDAPGREPGQATHKRGRSRVADFVPTEARSEPIPLGPISGKGQVPGLLNYLSALPFRGQLNLAEKLETFRHSIGRRSGLVLLLSDLLAVPDLGAALRSVPAPSWDVAVLHLLHPMEIQPKLRGDFEMRDIETGRTRNYDITPKALETYHEHLEGWRMGLETACVESKAFYTLISTGWAVEREVIPHLRRINLVKPL